MKIYKQKTFLDYLFGGLEIDFTVAIDFTESNKDKCDLDSLHFGFSWEQNKYLRAMEKCIAPLQPYNMTKKITAYGFGAQPMRNSPVSNCFALTGDIFKPEVSGIDGLLEAYRVSVDKVFFAGPNDPSAVIKEVSERARAS